MPEEKNLSKYDEIVSVLQSKFLEGIQKGDTDVMGKTMQSMMNFMMMMSFPKMMKQMMGDDDGNKLDALLKQVEITYKDQIELLRKEIQDLKQEKKEKELINEMERKLDPLKNALEEIKKEKEKQPDETTKGILEKIDYLQRQLEAMADNQKAEALSPITKELNELRRRLDELNTAKTRGDPLEDLLEQMEKIEKTKSRLASLLGIPQKQAEDMSAVEVIDLVTKKGPEILNSAKSMYDIIKGKELTDDNPIPDIPEVAAPVRNPSMPKLDPELEKFIEEGHEEYIDPSDPSKGKMWVSKYGIPITTATNEPMSKDDVRKYALAYTDDFRRLKSEIEEYVKEQAESISDLQQAAQPSEPSTPSPPVIEPKKEETPPEQEPPKPTKTDKPSKKTEKKEENIEITDDMLSAAENRVE